MRRKDNVTLIEWIVAVAVVLLFFVVVNRTIKKTDSRNARVFPDWEGKTTVFVGIMEARPEFNEKAKLIYKINDQWDYAIVEFRVSLRDGSLESVVCTRNIRGGELVFDSQSEYPEEDTFNQEPINWGTWLKRFMDIQEQAITGLNPDTEKSL